MYERAPLFISLNVILVLLFSSISLYATELGSPANNTSGADAFGTAVGVYGAVDVGNDEVSGSTLSDLVGQGGNAITVCFPNELAPQASQFSITTINCANSGNNTTQVVNISAVNAQGVCNDVNAINQGCSWRNEACTHNGLPGGSFDVVAPFLCTVSNWQFLTGVIPGRATTVDITGITDMEAADVDLFRLTVNGGTTINLNSADFTGVTNGVQLAALLSSSSSLINVSYAGTTLTITASSTGPTSFSNLRLEFITPATTASVEITGITDSDAAIANLFNIHINNSAASTSGLDFSTVSNGSQLASLLDTVSNIDVSYDSINGKLDIQASAPGSVTFSQVMLRSRLVVTVSGSALDYTENEAPITIAPSLSIGPSGSGSLDAIGAIAYITPFSTDDELSYSPSGGISGSYNPATGVLTFSNTASRDNYATVLQSVAYFNSSENPDQTQRLISFQVYDATDNSSPGSRQVNINAENDDPEFTGTPTITGKRQAGHVLALTDTGTTDVDGDTVTLSYQWLADHSPISGATQETYKLSGSEAGKAVSCTITANDGKGGTAQETTQEVTIANSRIWTLILPIITTQDEKDL